MTGLEYKNNLSGKRHGADPNWEDVTDAYEDGIAEGYRRCKAEMLKEAENRIVKEDAGGYPYIDATELYDYTEDKPLAKSGDKVKIIIIKEDKQ